MTPNPAVSGAILAAARATGASADYLVAAARKESAFDADAKAATSSASGLFQFIERTWLDSLARYGEELGLKEAAAAARGGTEARAQALSLRFDPKAAALMAGALANENAKTLAGRLGRDASTGELYAAHVLGAGDAARLIETAARNPDLPAAQLFPRAAAANRGLFHVAGRPATVAELRDRLAAAITGAPAAPAAPGGSPARVSAPRQTFVSSSAPRPALMLTDAALRILADLDAPEGARKERG